MTIYQGNAHVYGNNLVPLGYSESDGTVSAANFVLAEIDPEFAGRVKTGDILVAGENFGGEADSAEALKSAGIAAIVATSFTPQFLRSAKRAGMPVFVIEDHRTEMEDPITIDTERGLLTNGVTGHQAHLTLPK